MGGPLWSITPPQGVVGVMEIVWGGETPPFLGGIPPNPALGMMASAPGTGVEHGGGEAVPPHPPPPPPGMGGTVTTNPVWRDISGCTPIWVPPIWVHWGGWGAQPHRIMGRPLQLDFDLGARGVRGTVTWGKRGGHEHQWGGGTQPRSGLMPQ